MKVGRRMDRIIAQKVMGETVVETDDCNGDDNYWLARPSLDKWDWPGLPRYSTDIAAAWEVLEKLRESGDILSLNWYPGAARWECVIHRLPLPTGEAKTAPHAISLAALACVGVTVE